MRPHLIKRTLEAFEGCKQGIVHAYIAPSDLHMKQVFEMSKEQLIDLAVSSTKQISDLVNNMTSSDIRYEFSPEEFTDTDISFSLELCNKVYKAWGKATKEKPIIFNLPATVERRPPNHYADMIELFNSCLLYTSPSPRD